MITRANVQDVVDTGAVTTAEICAGITDPCAALGLQLSQRVRRLTG